MRRLLRERERSKGGRERADKVEKEVGLLDHLKRHSVALALGVRTHEFVRKSL